MKRIRDILTRNKTRVPVEDGTLYKQVTVRMNYKGVVLRGTQFGATIGTKDQFKVSAGQFLLSKIDARNGAFGIIPDELEGAIITNSFLAFDINENEVEPDFFNVFLQSPVFLDACIKASKGTTNRKPVDEDFFLNYEVNLPPLREQHALIKQINYGRTHIATAQHELTHQETLLGQLQQAILQEAIAGKLTADWRAAHPEAAPASQLLHRIQSEKARLIAAKQLRPEKPLPKITPEEIPFEIPKTWEWCRLGQGIRLMNGGSFESRDFGKGDGVKCIKITNAGVGEFVETDDTLPLGFDKTYAKYKVSSGDLILALTRPYISTGLKISRCPESYDGALLNQRVAAIRPIEGLLDSGYAFLFLNSGFVLRGYQAEFDSKGQQPNLKSEHVTHLCLPLPPLAEQAAIVARVDSLLESSRLLAAEIAHTRTHAAHLLQAVLKEAFTPAAK